MALAAIPTRLEKMDDTLQEQLINWGYAISDAALRAYGGAASASVFRIRRAESDQRDVKLARAIAA
jgi:hypothetical protein